LYDDKSVLSQEGRYVVFQPDLGGWNNIRMGAESVVMFALATGRTLVLPPNAPWYLLNKVIMMLLFYIC
jgi:hypothetical protein